MFKRVARHCPTRSRCQRDVAEYKFVGAKEETPRVSKWRLKSGAFLFILVIHPAVCQILTLGV